MGGHDACRADSGDVIPPPLKVALCAVAQSRSTTYRLLFKSRVRRSAFAKNGCSARAFGPLCDSARSTSTSTEPCPPFWSKQNVGSDIPTPSVKSSSVEIYASKTEYLVVEGDNFFMDTRLIFDPALQDETVTQRVGGFTKGIPDRRVSPQGGLIRTPGMPSSKT